jgi:NAD(P)-dependent dehydrogenase (short-subunit alcohol dehydrogenase family)
MTSLTGKVAIVTGASREIGAAMATALAQAGAAVLVSHYREAALAEAVAADLRAKGGTAEVFEADCSDVAQNQALVNRAVAAFGRLDIFAANAGLTRYCPFLEYDEATYDTVMDLNLKGSFFGAQAAARQMIAQGSPGSIVFSSSVTGVSALPGLSAYGVTKAGLRHMARCLALELGPHRLTVNALGIGAIVNERNLRDDPRFAEHWASVSPVGRVGYPEDVANALLYLVQNPYITGTTLMVDGGWTIYSPLAKED